MEQVNLLILNSSFKLFEFCSVLHTVRYGRQKSAKPCPCPYRGQGLYFPVSFTATFPGAGVWRELELQ